MKPELMHEVGQMLEQWFEEMERGARRPPASDAEVFASAAFRRARPGAEH